MLPTSFNRDWVYFKDTGNRTFDPHAAQVARVPVTLPHDATIREERSPDAPGGSAKGYYPNGAYVYLKRFDAPADWADKRVSLLFEGAYMNARVFLNGDFAGQCPHGYSEFSVHLNDFLRFGEANELSVSLYSDLDSRWYAGAGLYRNVHLYVADPLHIALHGVKLTTLSADAKVAAVSAEITVENEGLRARNAKVEIVLVDADGGVACRDLRKLNIRGKAAEVVCPRLYVENPRLWSPDAPNLYRAEVRLWEGDAVTDAAVVETFGLRVLTLDPVRGLAVNGRTVKLYGGCIHHDNGVIGAATIDRAEERRVELLKSAGYNAIRSAHHPMSRALLAACDRCGVLVMDELTDMWHTSKTMRDYGAAFESRWREDVRAMVIKDYNHPSVAMYSMGNEIPESGKPAGAAIYRKLAALTRALDPTRYITAGLNSLLAGVDLSAVFGQQKPEGEINSMMSDLGAMMQKLSCLPEVVEATSESYESMDICGYNYATDRAVSDCAQFTNRISVGAETFPKDLAYNWKIVRENPRAIGDFSWTSWDYLGEAGIGRDKYRKGAREPFGGEYPWRIAWDADFDITGRRTPQGYYREIVVDHRAEPYVAMQDPAAYEREPFATAWSWPGTVSSWNWPGYEGKPIRVEVYGKGDEAELIVNGESLGRRPIPRESVDREIAFRTVFEAAYAPGKVEAVLYAGGAERGRYCVESADEKVELDVRADREQLRGDDGDLAFVDILLRDARGRVNPGADRKLRVRVEGAGVLQGFGSGNPRCEGNFWEGEYPSFYGHALAVIRPAREGEIIVTVEAEGCESAARTIRVGR